MYSIRMSCLNSIIFVLKSRYTYNFRTIFLTVNSEFLPSTSPTRISVWSQPNFLTEYNDLYKFWRHGQVIIDNKISNYFAYLFLIMPSLNTQSCIKGLLVVLDFCFWAIWAARPVHKKSWRLIMSNFWGRFFFMFFWSK